MRNSILWAKIFSEYFFSWGGLTGNTTYADFN